MLILRIRIMIKPRSSEYLLYLSWGAYNKVLLVLNLLQLHDKGAIDRCPGSCTVA